MQESTKDSAQSSGQNPGGAAPESRESKLITLLDLMASAPSLKSLPPERIRQIKEKYLRATDDSIDTGIKMLQENNGKLFNENIELKKQIQEDAQKEKYEAEKAASNILKELENKSVRPEKKSKNMLKILGLLLITAVVVAILILTNRPPTPLAPAKITTPASSKSGAFQKAPSSIPHRSPPVKSAPFVK